MKLTIDQIERFKGQINLKKINIQGQIKLSNTKVLIIGAGGIGSPVALFLARSGIKYFEIADFDKVSKSNLHRQVLFDEKDINKNKALVTKKKISLIDKKIKVKTFQTKINKANIKKLIKDYDYVIDGTDNFSTKTLINDECLKQKKKLFIGSVSQFDCHVFYFNFALKGSCLKCFMPQIPKITPRCQDEGILGTVTGTAGSLIANELIKEVTGINSDLLNHVLIINFEKLNFRKVKINSSAKCKNHH